MSFPVLRARVDASIKERFQQRAAAHGLSESEQLRALVLAFLDGAPASGPVPIDPENADLERITVRLPAFLLESAKGRAAALGMAPSRWIASLVHSNLRKEPVTTETETAALQRCTYELSAIGRNINQIARALNQAPNETERVKLDTLKVLAESIGRTRENIRALVRASRNVWSID